MTDSPALPRTPKIFYGWILVAVLLLILSVGMGTSMYMYSVVAGAVGAEFAASRFMLMLGSTGLLLMIGLYAPLLGRLLDRYPSRWTLVSGALMMGLGFIFIAISTNMWMVVASYVFFIGVGAATLSTLATATLLSRWFVRRRGLAIGIAALGTQFGGFFYPPILAAAMEAYSWRLAIGGMGVVVMVLLPLLIWLLVVDRPENKHQYPDGDLLPPPQPQGTRRAVAAAKVPFLTLFSQRNFLFMVLIVGVASASNTVLLANLSLFATDMGEPPVRGALLISLSALLGIFFSPFIGWLCDVINIRLVAVIVSLSLAVSCLVFSLATAYPVLLVATIFQGIGGGGVFPLWASLVGHLYHTRIYGQVMGATTLVAAVITAAAPLYAGWVYDLTQSYRVLFITLMIVLVLMAILATRLRVPRTHQEKYGAVDTLP